MATLSQLASQIDLLGRRLRETTRAGLVDRPRHVRMPLAAIATGQTLVEVSWAVPIDGDYVAVPVMIGAAANVGLLTAAQQANTQVATGCTIIVSNRTAGTIAAAVLDLLVHPT